MINIKSDSIDKMMIKIKGNKIECSMQIARMVTELASKDGLMAKSIVFGLSQALPMEVVDNLLDICYDTNDRVEEDLKSGKLTEKEIDDEVNKVLSRLKGRK